MTAVPVAFRLLNSLPQKMLQLSFLGGPPKYPEWLATTTVWQASA
jgi:hypothetical protein